MSQIVAAKKNATTKDKRIAWTISGTRLSTVNWFKERAFEADLPLSKYISLLLDGIKRAGEDDAQGGGGNRTRQLLASWFSEAGRRATAQGRAA